MPPDEPTPISQMRHAELCRAITELSVEARGRLLRFAEQRSYATGCSALDLFQEAVRLMLDGSRRAWKAQTLERDLFSILKSVAFHRRAKFLDRRKRERRFAEREQEEAETGKPRTISPHDTLERQLDARKRVEGLKAHFEDKDDTEATLVIDGMAEGNSMREAADSLGLTPKQYDAVRKRLNRYRSPI